MRLLRRHALAALLCSPVLALAADWPERPITIVVPAAAGGTTDIAARVLAEKMSSALKTNIIIENKAGGGGSIGTAFVARAKPDGYTLLMGNIGPVAINFSLYKKLQYKESDLRGITNVISVPNILVVNADTPVKNVQELIAWGKQKPLTAATSGIGQSPHMSSEMFRQKAGLDVTLVPHSGAAPAVTALLGKQTDFMIDNLPSSMPHIKSGKFRALAITSKERSAQLPDVPTMQEAGVPMEVTAWFDLLAPAGTPDAVVANLRKTLKQSLADPAVQAAMGRQLQKAQWGEPEVLNTKIVQERASWKKAVQALNFTPES